MDYLGSFALDVTNINCFFTTHAASGAPVEPSSALATSDFLIYKEDGTVKSTADGLTLTSTFAGKVGLHRLVIDVSNDTGGPSGFWTPGYDGGSQYTIILSTSKTVDGIAITGRAIATFQSATLATAVWRAPVAFLTDLSGSMGELVAQIRTKTNSLTFTKTNEVDANVQSVNGVTVTGDGEPGTEWGP